TTKRARIRDDGAMAKRRCKPSLTRCPLRGRNCCRPRNAGHNSSSDTRHGEEQTVRSSSNFYRRIAQAQIADEFATNLMPAIQAMRNAGALTLSEIASALNARRARQARGGIWQRSSV